MSMTSLTERIESKGTSVAVELHPYVDAVSATGVQLEQKLLNYNRRIIDATCKLTPAYIINPDEYNLLNPIAWRIMSETAQYISNSDGFLIFDSKFHLFSRAARHVMEDKNNRLDGAAVLSPDAVTILPYFGEECLQPFVFSINKTSKVLFIYLNSSDKFGCEGYCELIEEMSGQAMGSSRYSNIGIILSDNDSTAAWRVRKRLRDCVILTHVKKITPQIKDYFNSNGSGALLSFDCYKQNYDDKTLEKDVERELERIIRAVNRTLFKKSKIIRI